MPETTRLAAALADRYRIERELGAGGMATVYLAHDVRHDRQVALKVLRPELAAVLGAERFVQEIKTTAHLQHPHILPLFDSGQADGFLYYVMPFIDGETLRHKLDRETQLSIDEAVRITRDVAEALDYAHRQGVVHRDIKPENVLLHDGRSMVADFGIALAVSAAAGGRMTETGLSLGTPHYMSPEQATAEKNLTNRSDIYSLGTVLYEMLTGNPPHTGASAQQIIMRIVTEEPTPVTRVRRSVPANVSAALGKALEKLPADRFDRAKAFAEALGNPAFTVPGRSSAGLAVAAGPKGVSRRMFVAVVALAAVLFAVSIWSWLRPVPTPPRPVVRFEVKPPQPGPGEFNAFAVSPDGGTIVWNSLNVSTRSATLWLRRLGDFDLTSLPVSSAIPIIPSFSPAGDELAFVAHGPSWEGFGSGTLQIVPVAGGPPRSLADSVDSATSWGTDGYLYFTREGRLKRILARGGPIEDLTPQSSDSAAQPGPLQYPTALPDGRGVLAWSTSGSIGVLDLRSRAWRKLVRGGFAKGYIAPGYLLYIEGSFLMAVPFNLDNLTLGGTPTPILDMAAGDFSFFAVGGGTLVYQVASRMRTLALRRRDGVTRLIPNLPNGQWFQDPAVSPDGRKLAVAGGPPSTNPGGGDIWVYELPTGPLTRLTFVDGPDFAPTWTPDGRRVLYSSGREGKKQALYRQAWDGGGAPELVLRRARHISRASWLPDGDHFVFEEAEEVFGPRDIQLSSLSAPDSVRPLVVGPFDERWPAVSPDGRWLAYQSNESGQSEVYVRPLEGRAVRRRISRQGGERPAWGFSGHEIFFLNRDTLYAARVDGREEMVVRDIQPLFKMSVPLSEFAVVPGDSLFLVMEPTSVRDVVRPVIAVLNFDRELEARFGRKR